ncbi:RNA polymerase sigma factor [Chitinophaga pinensis]|uniref:RNA polymerase sigma factor n=1 Tax=Chitinophaga pinensis TaxID=79329 RepID=UPI0016472929|nr:sigma-70 family RNA polymerase sigma factor [Chitinophaga pinensis]
MSGEQLLWDAVRNSDVKGLEALYKQYNEALYSYGKKFTGDTHLVEDAVQETFISIWKYRERLSVTSMFNLYIFKSFRNHLFRLIKEQQNIAYQEDDLSFSFELGFDARFIEGEEAAMLSAQIRQALSRLTSRQREIIWFRFFEGRSFEEIAEIMDMQVRATYKLSARALASLKEIMEGPALLLLLSFLKN